MAEDAGELNRPWQLWADSVTGWAEDGFRSDDEPGPEPPRFYSALEAEDWAALREEEERHRATPLEAGADSEDDSSEDEHLSDSDPPGEGSGALVVAGAPGAATRFPALLGKRPPPSPPTSPPASPPRLTARTAPAETSSLLPAWDSEESRAAAAHLRDRPTDFRREAKRDEAMRWAAESGLTDIHLRPADVFDGHPHSGELHSLRLLRAASYRMAHESVDPERLRTALRHWRLFRGELPSRRPFLPLSGAGSPGAFEADQYNAETLELFMSSIMRRGSLQPGRLGEPIDTKTASGYVSAIRAFISREGGVQMRNERCNIRSKAVQQCIRRTRGPTVSRRRRLGIRATDLRAAEASGSLDRHNSWSSRRRWCAAVVGHQLVARGAELGRADGRAFSQSRGLRWRDIEWRDLGTLSRTHLVVVVHMCAAKDVDGSGQRFPLLIRRRAAGTRALDVEDPMCAYDLLLAAWREDVAALGAAAALDRPVFRRSCTDGPEHAFKTSTMLSIAREVASAAGLDPSDVGGHSFRIGGATDFRDLYDTSSEGLAEATRVLKARGRWKSDIAFIYTRVSAVTALEASARVADVDTRDIEAMFAGWAQPAR